jgi:hypothetical protein
VIDPGRRRPPSQVAPQHLIVLNGEQSPIIDSSPYNRTVTAVGSPAPSISTTHFQYGNSSIFYPNTLGSYLLVSSNEFPPIGTGDFTFQAFARQTAFNNFSAFLEIGNHLLSSGIIFIAGNNAGKNLQIYSNGFYGSGTVPLNAMNFVAYVRESGILSIYANGVRTSQTPFTNNLTATGPITFGSSNPASANAYNNSYRFAGWVDGACFTPAALYSGPTITIPPGPF